MLLALALSTAIAATDAPGERGARATDANGWRLLAYDREAAPPGPPGVTAVTAEVAVPPGAATVNRHSVRIRVAAEPANLKPYVSWHVNCGVGHASFSGDGFHKSSYSKTFEQAPNCEADVTATLFFWTGASDVRVWVYVR